MKIPRLEVNWEEIPMPDKIRNFVPKKKEPDGKSGKDLSSSEEDDSVLVS